jgi:hypothetical protein
LEEKVAREYSIDYLAKQISDAQAAKLCRAIAINQFLGPAIPLSFTLAFIFASMFTADFWVICTVTVIVGFSSFAFIEIYKSYISRKYAVSKIHRSIYVTPMNEYTFDWSGELVAEIPVKDGYNLGIVVNQKPLDDLPYMLLLYKGSYNDVFRFTNRTYWIYGVEVNCPQVYDTLVEMRVLPEDMSLGAMNPDEVITKIPMPLVYVSDAPGLRREALLKSGHLPGADIVNEAIKAYDTFQATRWKELALLKESKIKELEERMKDVQGYISDIVGYILKKKRVTDKAEVLKQSWFSKLSTPKKVGFMLIWVVIAGLALFFLLSALLA